ncbi:MAG: carboxypeptidase regulatory-like domain-containing protein [Armatimonadota bacterium]
MKREPRFIILSMSALTLTMASISVLAANYYISPTGIDSLSRSGSSSQPWFSLSFADQNNKLNAGDQVLVQPGTYNYGATQYINACSGIQGSPITYKANGTVNIQFTDPSSTGVWINGGQYRIFDGFNFIGSNCPMYVAAAATEVKNCTLSSTNVTWCLMPLVGAPNSYIHSNIFTGTGSGMALSWGSTATRIYNNVLSGLPGWAINAQYTSGCADNGIEVKNNIIVNCGGGIYDTTASHISHDYNLLYNTPGFGGSAAQQAHETTTENPMLDSVYHPTKFSPAIDAGVDVGLPYYWVRPDIGAFEMRTVGKYFDLQTACWYEYTSSGTVDVTPVRWITDLQMVKKAGLHGVWTINAMADYRYGGSWTQVPTGAWNDAAIANLRHMVAYADSIGLTVVLGMAYGSFPPSAFLDSTQFNYYIQWVQKIVQETAVYDNVMYVFSDECINGPWYDTAPDYPELVSDFKNWCYNQNTSISYWNSRWGTNFTWDTITPPKYSQGWGTTRRADYFRWMYASVLRPRLAQIGDVAKTYAPNSLLGYHEWLLGSEMTDPAWSPLASLTTYDVASSPIYGGLSDAQWRVQKLRSLFPGHPLCAFELGTALAANPPQEPFQTKPYLDGQKVGYNWWQWWMTNSYPDQWDFIDENGHRRTSFSLYPNAANYGTIRGQITNASTGANLNYIGVIAGGHLSQSVDKGLYRLDLDPGTYTVEFAQPGYERIVVTGVVVTAGLDTTLDATLNPVSNMVANPGVNTGISSWTTQSISGGKLALVSYDPALHPAWDFFDAVEGQGYLVIGAQPSPGETLVYQDVSVSPNTTYTLSWWEKVVGSKFDGWSATSADQWLKVSIDQKQGATWGGPIINLQQMQNPTSGWQRVETIFRTGPATTNVRIKFDAKFVSGQTFTGTFDTPHVGMDCVHLLQSTEQLTEATSIADAKSRPDGALVAVTGVGTACFPNATPACAYIESSDRSSAMKVYTTNASVGNPMSSVRIMGRISTNAVTGEKEITDEFGIQNIGAGSVKPVGMVNRSVGNGDGLSTVGLLVKTFGAVKSIAADRKSFVIDDGSGTPVNVMDFGYDVPSWMQVGSYVDLIGVSSLVDDGAGKRLRVPQWYCDTVVPWRP